MPLTACRIAAVLSRVLCFLFSNCYLVLFDKEKGVVWLLACFFLYSPETSASHFFLPQRCKFSCTRYSTHPSEQGVRCSGFDYYYYYFFCFWVIFAKRGFERAPFPPGRIILHPRHQCQRTDTGAGRALASFVVWDAPDCSKRQRAAGEERNVFHFELIVQETTKMRHLISVVADVLPRYKFIQLLVYVAHCPSDTIGQ